VTVFLIESTVEVEVVEALEEKERRGNERGSVSSEPLKGPVLP